MRFGNSLKNVFSLQDRKFDTTQTKFWSDSFTRKIIWKLSVSLLLSPRGCGLQNVYHSECAIVSMLIHGFLFYKSHQNFQINLVFDWSESFSMHARFQIKRYLHDNSYDSCYCCTFHEKYDLMSSFISSINYCSFEFGSEFQSVHLCL